MSCLCRLRHMEKSKQLISFEWTRDTSASSQLSCVCLSFREIEEIANKKGQILDVRSTVVGAGQPWHHAMCAYLQLVCVCPQNM